MKTTRLILLLGAVLACALSLTGCMANQGDVQASPTPAPTAEYDPGSGATRNAAGQTDTGSRQSFDWANRVGEIEDKISTLSEVAENRVVVSGTTALVGVKFAAEYQGEMTQRIRDMVASQVMQADSAIQTVAVTADTADVEEIYEMSDRLAGGEDVGQMETDVERIVRNAATLR